jgi:hypothetical protein
MLVCNFMNLETGFMEPTTFTRQRQPNTAFEHMKKSSTAPVLEFLVMVVSNT